VERQTGATTGGTESLSLSSASGLPWCRSPSGVPSARSWRVYRTVESQCGARSRAPLKQGRGRGRRRRTRRARSRGGRASRLVRRHGRGAYRPPRATPASTDGDLSASRGRRRNSQWPRSSQRHRGGCVGRSDRNLPDADPGGRHQPATPSSIRVRCADCVDTRLQRSPSARNRQPFHARPRCHGAEGLPASPLPDRAPSGSSAGGRRRRWNQPVGRSGLPTRRGGPGSRVDRAVGCASAICAIPVIRVRLVKAGQV
jgi:hypothetical protein